MGQAQLRHVVITRPVGGAGSLPKRLAAMDLAPVHLPGLSLGPGPTGQVMRDQLAALADFHAVIAVSAPAVRFARRMLPALRLPAQVRGYGVGAASARALQAICAVRVEWPQRADSEGLLALPSLAAVRGRRIAILAAPGGRSLIADTLRERGARAEVLHVYRRQPARWNRGHREKLAALYRPLVLATSVAGLRAVVSLAGDLAAHLLQGCAVVSSERLANAARDAGFTEVVRADGPGDAALLEAVRAHISNGRTW
ncbi:MAG TPA: uroporphyrinogen-III synthase [Xanthomonadaceae bacterium]|nr:uroporphyrinogen-III synthase [Xanthomonadaceae bacterium]